MQKYPRTVIQPVLIQTQTNTDICSFLVHLKPQISVGCQCVCIGLRAVYLISLQSKLPLLEWHLPWLFICAMRPDPLEKPCLKMKAEVAFGCLWCFGYFWKPNVFALCHWTLLCLYYPVITSRHPSGSFPPLPDEDKHEVNSAVFKVRSVG